MPYKSLKQERFFHTQTAKDKGIKPSTVKEFDQASKGMSLPETAENDMDASKSSRYTQRLKGS